MIRVALLQNQDRYSSVATGVAKSILKAADADVKSLPKDRTMRSKFIEETRQQLRSRHSLRDLQRGSSAEDMAEVIALSFAQFTPTLDFD